MPLQKTYQRTHRRCGLIALAALFSIVMPARAVVYQPFLEPSPSKRILKTTVPKYPRRAKKENLTGVVTIRFHVTEDGRPKDVEVVESMPIAEFGESIKKAVRDWIYLPSFSGCRYNDITFVQSFAFRRIEDDWSVGYLPVHIDNKALAAAKPEPAEPEPPEPTGASAPAESEILVASVYPKKAAREGIDGRVLLAFDVLPDGTTTNVEILFSYPKRVFDKSAVNAVQAFKYKGDPNREVVSTCHSIVYEVND